MEQSKSERQRILYKLPNEIEAINEILAEEIDQKDIDFVKSLSEKEFLICDNKTLLKSTSI
jgi:hypothetical protein